MEPTRLMNTKVIKRENLSCNQKFDYPTNYTYFIFNYFTN